MKLRALVIIHGASDGEAFLAKGGWNLLDGC